MSGGLIVLAYHAIADHAADPVLRRYSVPRRRFAAQLDMLARAGYRFVDGDAVLRAARGEGGLPRRALLVTFDDAYENFERAALPELRRRGIPTVLFAVSDLIGAHNEWDASAGATPLALLDAAGLRRVSEGEVEIGSHGRRHRSMEKIAPGALEAEAVCSADALRACGLPRPRLFAYPHGQATPEARAAVRRGGYLAAFSIDPGVVGPRCDPMWLPRIMVLRCDRPLILRLRIVLAARPWRRLTCSLADHVLRRRR